MDIRAPTTTRGGGVDLDEIMRMLEGERSEEVLSLARAHTKSQIWFPSPGPQTEAYFSEADELFYGGAAGGGKTDLLVGLATTAHRRSLILRRQGTDLGGIEERLVNVCGNDGYNSQKKRLRYKRGPKNSVPRIIELSSCPHEKDKTGFQGQPHDLKGFDEICHFTESQYTYIIGWNRPGSGVPEYQRCRVVVAGNPPDGAEGEWVRRRWAPWLDPGHPNPAADGELRWFTTIDGVDTEVTKDWRGIDEQGNELRPKSRTFIHANLGDNPYLGADYRARIAAMPEPYRSQLLLGDFQAGVKDHEYQIIPTSWVNRAIRIGKQRKSLRERGEAPRRVMTSMGLDCALGGKDNAVLAPMYDNHTVDDLIRKPGKEILDGTYLAAMVIQHHRDYARVNIDMGGGYGDACYVHLKDRMVPTPAKYTGSSTKELGVALVTGWGFKNKRTQYLWRLREALDPTNPANEGCELALPDDPKMKADLCASRFTVKAGIIVAEEKSKLIERIGRSPDDGDAVMLAVNSPPVHPEEIEAQRSRYAGGVRPGMLKVKRGYAHMKGAMK
jgi:hypothetical protein